ncbi:peptidyl-tRNA hydrolase [Candidatus Woesearchaeota archaeon]|jgi:peptidyl-tRNA hydrolase, PTH2 family|nr:peptidyl-tRNA hydrolase [Candidatus Woesearchaeota archaeon]MBT5273124.1 peptidyl-tRNA hydrolase [Candidatus Woesearchaeota archaeon]MBT6040611.1 peptidyl-tRNA hydrolase [Candidatus Woesearchaeota archaeon]MBT6337561.1 peptidyl-tRNA hydrolase [Candidatus Woesearchaeota archaeon]MBT7927038.1 peptidyl-tRNA hydrolase [Candidatus Woesearchaeota archaeon]
MELKQVILVRNDLKMSKGKIAAQSAHASVDAVLKALKSKSGEEKVKAWRREGMMKIAIKVDSEKELYKYMQQAKDQGMITSIITDAGKTFVAPGTVTCGCIGPADIEEIDEITGKLKIL